MISFHLKNPSTCLFTTDPDWSKKKTRRDISVSKTISCHFVARWDEPSDPSTTGGRLQMVEKVLQCSSCAYLSSHTIHWTQSCWMVNSNVHFPIFLCTFSINPFWFFFLCLSITPECSCYVGMQTFMLVNMHLTFCCFFLYIYMLFFSITCKKKSPSQLTDIASCKKQSFWKTHSTWLACQLCLPEL